MQLSLLRAFEAAARTGSFRDAAAELHLSPSAISHAVRKLEKEMGVVLFARSGPGRATQSGRAESDAVCRLRLR